MATRPKALDIARKVFGHHGGMLRTGEALQLGIHPRTLNELRDRGELERIGRGLYRLANAPHSIFCLKGFKTATSKCAKSRSFRVATVRP